MTAAHCQPREKTEEINSQNSVNRHFLFVMQTYVMIFCLISDWCRGYSTYIASSIRFNIFSMTIFIFYLSFIISRSFFLFLGCGVAVLRDRHFAIEVMFPLSRWMTISLRVGVLYDGPGPGPNGVSSSSSPILCALFFCWVVSKCVMLKVLNIIRATWWRIVMYWWMTCGRIDEEKNGFHYLF